MNHIALMGRLTKDVEIRYTSTNNTAVARFTLAVDKPYKKGEEKQADFINCVAWGKTAEFINTYFVKGKLMILEGRISTRTWETEGKKNYATEVTVEQVYFGDSKSDKPTESTSELSDTQDGFFPVDNDTDLPF